MNGSTTPTLRTERAFPALPPGFRPESLVVDPRGVAYLGSLADGRILAVDLTTGAQRTVRPGTPGRQAGGLRIDDHGRLVVAGGFGGDADIVDPVSGALLATYRLATTGPGLVADVVLHAGSAWFTDSFVPVLYRVPLPADGTLPGPDEVARIPLSGDVVYSEGFNLGGITTTPDGTALLCVQAGTGLLFRIDPDTGSAVAVDLGPDRLPHGDGITRVGTTLYVALGRDDAVAVVELDGPGTRGTVVERIGSPSFDVPTAVAPHDGELFVVNSRMATDPAPDTPYALTVLEQRPGPVLRPDALFHTGLVVDDLERAMATLSAVAGHRWTTVMELDVIADTGAGPRPAVQRFVLSLDEPRLELVQAVPGTVWTAGGGNGAHHVGYWAADIEAASAALVELGLPVEAGSEGEPLLWVYHRGADGTRIELLSLLMKPSMDAWLAGVDPDALAAAPLDRAG